MKTLVIHPKDSSTDFLSTIYADIDCQVITDPKVSKKALIAAIKDCDRIIMLGHGTENGLVDMATERFLIDSTFVYLLREKSCVCIWCNADVFVSKYKLKGLFSGMIVSEYMEAILFSLYGVELADIEHSNTLFATAIKTFINETTDVVEKIKSVYVEDDDNTVIRFNRNNIFYI